MCNPTWQPLRVSFVLACTYSCYVLSCRLYSQHCSCLLMPSLCPCSCRLCCCIGFTCCAGFTALAALTSLTGLQLVGQRYSARPPASAVQALSNLTALLRLRCDAGAAPPHGVGPDQLWSCECSAQQECWGTVLPRLTRLTRLELLRNVVVDDAMLCIICCNSPQLKHLVFDSDFWSGRCSKEGADAIAHVLHIELLCDKGLECRDNMPLMKLPGVTRVCWRHTMMFERAEAYVDTAWTQESCICFSCCLQHNYQSVN